MHEHGAHGLGRMGAGYPSADTLIKLTVRAPDSFSSFSCCCSDLLVPSHQPAASAPAISGTSGSWAVGWQFAPLDAARR